MGSPVTTRRRTHVKFVTDVPFPVNGRPVVMVTTVRGETLGFIEWYPPFKQHVFVPERGTDYSADCMDDISAKVKAMNEAGR